MRFLRRDRFGQYAILGGLCSIEIMGVQSPQERLGANCANWAYRSGRILRNNDDGEHGAKVFKKERDIS